MVVPTAGTRAKIPGTQQAAKCQTQELIEGDLSLIDSGVPGRCHRSAIVPQMSQWQGPVYALISVIRFVLQANSDDTSWTD
jgi:hypothetical protein